MTITTKGMAPLLMVFDMPTSLKFYCDVLGFEVVSSDEKPAPDFDWVLLKLEGTELMLNTAYERDERPAKADPARVAAHEDLSLYFGCPDVDATFNQLLPHSINVLEKPMTTSYKMRRFTITDPDGYNLSFQGPVVEQVS